MQLWSQVGGYLGLLGLGLMYVLARMWFRDKTGMSVRVRLWGMELERTNGLFSQSQVAEATEKPSAIEAEKGSQSEEDDGPALAT